MRTALVSVTDKTDLVPFLKKLEKFEPLRLIATGTTAKHLTENGMKCETVESLTKFPEILGGRVKTLHPHIFGGILARPTDEDKKQLADHGIHEIDYVIVNLYPFEANLKKNLSEKEMVELVDIGGVTLLRAAAKSFERVSVICDPSQYDSVIESVEAGGGKPSRELRMSLAHAAFNRTAAYDRFIGNYFAACIEADFAKSHELPVTLDLKLAQYQPLRYGENPHQAAVWYSNGRFETGADTLADFPPFEQMQGKDLSANNITDTYCLVKILRDIGGPGAPGACIIKHNNPCGVAVANTLAEAYDKAYATDPMAAFGGIYGFTDEVDEDLAKKIIEGFVEIVAAPSFSDGAIQAFRAKKNVRVLKLKKRLLEPASESSWHVRDLQDFGWIIEKDVEPPVQLAQFQCVAGAGLGKEYMQDAAFAWSVVKHLTSNAIFIAKNGVSLGFGIGQTSRIASVKIALQQAGEKARGAVMASDAFFPATDNIDEAAAAGISVIIQPGGSVKDKDVIAACEKHGITMLFTGQRCFKH